MKGIQLSEEEINGVLMAVLLHDIGHGPFSHALEMKIVENVHHEAISRAFITYFKNHFSHQFDIAKKIFDNTYERPFLHSLVSGQLDVDRLDYLRRDSFYTGVPEGMTGSERLIRMMNVRDEQLVVEKKGIYTVENYLIARQSMYWQVYLHKAVISSEQLLIRILQRAKELARLKHELFASPALSFFLYHDISYMDFNNHLILDNFARLEDNDVLLAIKVWMNHSDLILSRLCRDLINRVLPAIEVSEHPFPAEKINEYVQRTMQQYKISEEESSYFVYSGTIQNTLYDFNNEPIRILNHDGTVSSYHSPLLNVEQDNLHLPVQKYFLCYPKSLKKTL